MFDDETDNNSDTNNNIGNNNTENQVNNNNDDNYNNPAFHIPLAYILQPLTQYETRQYISTMKQIDSLFNKEFVPIQTKLQYKAFAHALDFNSTGVPV